MSDDIHEIYAIRYGQLVRPKWENFIGGDPHDSTMAAITYSGKGNTFDPGDPLLKLTVEETTGVDTTPPTVAFFTPANGAGGLPI